MTPPSATPSESRDAALRVSCGDRSASRRLLEEVLVDLDEVHHSLHLDADAVADHQRGQVGVGRLSACASWHFHTPAGCTPSTAEMPYTFPYRRLPMRTMSYTESRAHYAEMLDHVINDREEVVITRAGHEPVVVVSLEDYQSLKETAYLMRSPTNARRLLDAMERLEAGRGVAHDLVASD